MENEAIDVWIMFYAQPCDNGEDRAEYEANTFRDDDGWFRVDWYHTACGVVSSEYFPTYEEARVWLEESGYEDFTS